MARLDVYEAMGRSGPARVLEVQADFLATFAKRTVVPLIPEAHYRPVLGELNPVFDLEGER